MAIYKVKQGKPRYTPLWIEALQTDEVFVFGSNLRGFHGGGAARVAGCGIAGFVDSDIAPLFEGAMEIENICLPESFVEILSN